ncbi:MAG: response regulator [Mariprofundaceae bacterium]
MIFHVIDDQLIICEYISELLESFGHEALVFNSPIEYLKFLKDEGYASPAAVISDLSMPLMGGYEMIKRVQMKYPDQRFIIISGKPNLQDEYKNSSFIFLNKPFGIKQFEAVLVSLSTQEAA